MNSTKYASPMHEPKGQLKWSGDRWRARIRFKNGARKWIDLTPTLKQADEGEARKEAERLAKKAKREGWIIEPQTKPKGRSMRAWLKAWLAHKDRQRCTAVDTYRSLIRTWIEPHLGDDDMSTIGADRLRGFVEVLDDAVRREKIRWKTACNIWGVLTSAFGDASSTGKVNDLRVRKDNPTKDLTGPDRGMRTQHVHLYPSEFLSLVSCEAVPLVRRRWYAVTAYHYLRSSELRAMRRSDISIEHGTLRVDRGMQANHEEGTPKADTARMTLKVESALVPLLKAMLAEEGVPNDYLFDPGEVGDERTLAERLRADLLTAGVKRDDLHNRSKVRDWMRFHDLRGTGITWMAVRADDAFRIMVRAGHHDIETTQRYVREAPLMRDIYSATEVFPRLPDSLIDPSGSTGRGTGTRPEMPKETPANGGSAWESNPPAAP